MIADNTITSGYRQTDIGLMPDEWCVDSLERFWSVTDCKHITAEFISGGYAVASIKEVQSRYVDLSNANRTHAHFYNLLCEGGRKPRPGDLIMSRNATVGEVAQVADWHPPFAMGQDVCLLRKRSLDYSTSFMQSFLKSPVIAHQLSDLMVGSTFKRANVQQIKSFVIAMPEPVEQQAIAEALGDADAWIEALEQLLAKKRHLKQAAMQQLLTGKTRLPGFEGKWCTKRLGDICEVVMGQSPSSSNYNTRGDGVPLIQGNADIRNRQTIRRVFTTQVTKHGRTGDILLSVRAPVGEVAMTTFDVCLGRGVCAIRYPNSFLYYALIGREPAWAAISKGSTFDSVNSSDVNAFEVVLPADTTEQTAIAAVLADMDTEIESIEAKLVKARQIKQGMMQELLTGRTRLV